MWSDGVAFEVSTELDSRIGSVLFGKYFYDLLPERISTGIDITFRVKLVLSVFVIPRKVVEQFLIKVFLKGVFDIKPLIRLSVVCYHSFASPSGVPFSDLRQIYQKRLNPPDPFSYWEGS